MKTEETLVGLVQKFCHPLYFFLLRSFDASVNKNVIMCLVADGTLALSIFICASGIRIGHWELSHQGFGL